MSDDYRFHQYSGGCQCGAVRFHASELRDNPHVCYCRMCQKAMGNLFAALVGIRHEHLTWTRGTPATFQSSEYVGRGFCHDCGTPLFYQHLGGQHVSLSIGAFDEPHRIPVLYQMGLEGRHPSLLNLSAIEAVGTTVEPMAPKPWLPLRPATISTPDHYTAPGRRELEYPRHDQRASLYLRHHAARRRADGRHRVLVGGQDFDRRAARADWRRLYRGRLSGANPVDTEFFSERRTTRATFTAFGMTKRAGRSAANDPGLQGILNSKADAACFVAKTWDKQVEGALDISLEENLFNLRDTVLASVAAGKETLIDCEHFFDGFKANPDYALACVRTAIGAGARWSFCATPMAVLCRPKCAISLPAR